MKFETDFTDGRADHADDLITALTEKYGVLGNGFYRVTFRIGTHVFKFPLSKNGEYCNLGESSLSTPYFAKGRYVNYKGYICVMQEYLDPIHDKEKNKIFRNPEYGWIKQLDGIQIGRDRFGVVKAYDFIVPPNSVTNLVLNSVEW